MIRRSQLVLLCWLECMQKCLLCYTISFLVRAFAWKDLWVRNTENGFMPWSVKVPMPRNPARSPDSPGEIEPAGIHVNCQGESSDDNDDENPVSVKHRSQTMMWTFPTPRSYLGSLEDRRKANKFIPRDFARKDMAEIFLKVLAKQGKRDLLKEFIVVMEPHSKMTPDGSAKEMHFHIVFRMSTNFAHLQISNSLDKDYGCKGHMSHPRKGGWPSLVQYVLEQSAVKLPIHLDEDPYFWPDDQHMTKDKMLTRINKLHQHRPQTATNHVSTTFMRNKDVMGCPIPEKRNERKEGRQAPEPGTRRR